MKTKTTLLFLAIIIGQLIRAQTSYLYATTTQGGANGFGTILKGNPDGSNFHVIYSFDSINGSYPEGAMAQAGNGKLFGITTLGGDEDSCVIYCYDPTTESYQKIYDDMLQPMLGAVPSGGLITNTDGLLYGTTISYGLNSAGVIYTLDPNNYAYTDVYDFQQLTGSNPYSELLLAHDGKMYGTTNMGGQNGAGVLFRFNPVTKAYNVLYNFESATNSPYFATLIQATDGKLYGTTGKPGDWNTVLFSYDLTADTFVVEHNFDLNTEGTPVSGLVQAGNGKLYGTTTGASSAYQGGIYSYDLTNKALNFVVNFDANKGLDPARALTKAGSNKLMGSATNGGALGFGTLFSLDLSNNAFTKLLDFDSVTTGAHPSCNIQEFNTGVLGIAEPTSATAISVYPNPASHFIMAENISIGTPIAITNLEGDVVAKDVARSDKAVIEISKLAAGVYFLNSIKFVKQ